MKTFGMIATAVIFLGCIAATVGFLIAGPWPAAIGTGGVGVIFGIMTVRDMMTIISSK